MGSSPTMRARHAEPVDVYKRVVSNHYCIKCGENLRGQSVEAACPGCQHPIYDSIYEAFLVDAPAEESRRLYTMSPIVLYPMGLLAGLTGLWMVLTIRSAIAARSLSQAIDGLFDVILLCAMLFAVVALVGAFVFAGRRSAAYYLARLGDPAFLIRAGIVTVVILVAIVVFWSPLLQSLVQVGFAAGPTAYFLQRLGHLMYMVPNKKLAAYANTALGMCGVIAGLAVLVLLLRPFAPPGSEMWGFVMVLMGLATIATLGLGLVILRLVMRARQTLLAISTRSEE